MKTSFPRLPLVLLLLAGALGAGAGCTSPDLVRVHPWQRAALADYTMRPDRDTVASALSAHIYESRETAAGGRGVGGSGCGCN